VLILIAFTIVALVARSQWHQEPFADLYLDRTASGRRDVSIVYADLEGFTSFSESHDPSEVATMLNAFFAVAVPAVVRKHAGNVDNLIGDAIMVTFNARGDQPDHAERAIRAALELRDAAADVAARRPQWPRLRIGVNSGEVVVGLVGAEGGRRYTVIGDAVNVAARLEAAAPAGEAVVGESTVHRVPGAVVQAIAPVVAKGKSEPVRAFLLKGVD
jgi:class 3 adenylate cyclase